MQARPDRSAATTYERTLSCRVDSVRGRFSAWYEMFPRSVTPDATRSGTFREAEARLADIAAMGGRVLRDSRYEVIWGGSGYVMYGNAP